jgi:hypothetical protein
VSTISSLVAAFQTFNAGVNGVASAPQTMPATLAAGALPAAITLPGPARWLGGTGLGRGRKCERTYVVRVYVAAVDDDPAVVFAAAYALLEALGAAYRDVASIGGAIIQQRGGEGLEDGGLLRTQAYGGVQYYGFELRVPVLEQP